MTLSPDQLDVLTELVNMGVGTPKHRKTEAL